jgi:hypothetical protein
MAGLTRRLSHFSYITGFCLALSAATPAHAQSDEQRAAARSLAQEGANAFNQGQWKDAVDFFTRAETLVHAPPHLLFLARAREKLGQLVAAREAYLKIIKETLPPSAPQAFRDAQAAAHQELGSVEPRIASLTIQVQGAEGAKDLKVMVDGVTLQQVLVGVARPVDPGDHKVEAVATGFRAVPQQVRLNGGERKTLTIALVPDPNAAPQPVVGPDGAPASPSAPVAPLASGPATGAETLSTGTQAPESGKKGMRIGSYVAFGVGAVGLGVGSYFLMASRSKRKDADAAYDACAAAGDCRTNDPGARKTSELDDDARSAMTLSIVGLALGGVGVATGVTLLVLSSGESQEQSSAWSIQPFIGLGGAGLSGQF